MNMRINSNFLLVPVTTNLTDREILFPLENESSNVENSEEEATKASLAQKDNESCYDLDVSIQQLPSSPLAVTGTVSVCGDTCSQSYCTNYTCDGGRNC